MRPLSAVLFSLIVVGSLAVSLPRGDDVVGRVPGDGPVVGDYARPGTLEPVPEPDRGPGASTGTFEADCGRNEERRHNSDNVVLAPGLPASIHHTHEYVGNRSTTAASTDGSLAEATTTCANGDLSTYFWPVLRRLDRPRPENGAAGDDHGAAGEIVPPAAVTLEFRGNPRSPVVPAPRFLRAIAGDAGPEPEGDEHVRAQWGCESDPRRVSEKYALCRGGDRVLRRIDYPSCWDGRRTDSPDHREHLLFPQPNGACPRGTFPVPQLRVELFYDVPVGVHYAVDGFPHQNRRPESDHGFFVNVMPEELMRTVVDCLNEGRTC